MSLLSLSFLNFKPLDLNLHCDNASSSGFSVFLKKNSDVDICRILFSTIGGNKVLNYKFR